MTQIGVVTGGPRSYPIAPFHPPKLFPEFAGAWAAPAALDPRNEVYSAVREAMFRALRGWSEGSVDIDVLRQLSMRPRTVVIKPNWVCHDLHARDSITTHGAVLRPMIDYLLLAFGRDVQIIVADIPIQSALLDRIWDQTGINALRAHYSGIAPNVEFADFRREAVIQDDADFRLGKRTLPGDPRGYVQVDLGAESWLEEITASNVTFSVSDYEPGLASCYHRSGVHSYLISRSVLEADLFVNVPKLKTHHKAGFTCCMKNLVGINGEKGWIPHYREGSPLDGGDEFPDEVRRLMRLKKAAKSLLQSRHRTAFRALKKLWLRLKRAEKRIGGGKLTDGGAWPGNDTIWRVVLDLQRIMSEASGDGNLAGPVKRSILCVVDGVICGEGDGPLDADPAPAGVVIAGTDMVACDLAAAALAGFEPDRLPQLREARKLLTRRLGGPPESTLSVSWSQSSELVTIRQLPSLGLKPPRLWRNAFESSGTMGSTRSSV